MPTNNLESTLHRDPLSEADRAWYLIVRRAAIIPEVQTQVYVQQTIQREVNGEVPILPTPEQLEQMTAHMNTHARWTMRTSLVLVEEIRASVEITATILANDDGDFIDYQADGEEGTGIRFSPSQVEDFLQTLSPVEISTLRTDDTKCSICKEEYGKERGKSTNLVSDADQRLPGEETSEYPVKLSCRHVFGDWCIKAWLLRQPASCPTCRFQFGPVR